MPLPSTIKQIKTQVKPNTPEKIVEIIAQNVDMANEARKRIDEEGIVVRDMSGKVVSHPAIKIEADANKIITEMLTMFAPQHRR